MKPSLIVGALILVLVYLWLCQALIRGGGGWTLKNIFIMAASGIIIFVPLYKKYFKQNRQ